MIAPHAVRIIEDRRFQDHRGPQGHPERPERLVAIGEAIDLFRDQVEIRPPRAAELEEILRVHREQLVDFLASTRTATPGHIDADTYYSSASFDVACLAAGSAVDLARSVMRGECAGGLAAIRPPGHHAEAHRSMGFCLFNNVAIAARAIQAEFDSPRILILDWDVHHGNGTQHLFEDDPSVLYVSTHQFPFYPGTGDFGEAGRGPGLGATMNVPMPAGCGDEEYIGVMERLIVPAALRFAPDLILVSCGFDAHRDDPLASMELSLAGYRVLAHQIRSLADELCGGRIVHVLEGGYALSGVREGAQAVLESLVAPPGGSAARAVSRSSVGPASLEVGSALRTIIDRVVDVHGRWVPGLGAGSS